MVQDKTILSRSFSAVNYGLLTLIALVTIIPFIHVFAGSFASTADFDKNKFILFPTHFSLTAYQYIFSTDQLVRSLLVSVGITVVGTLVSMFLSSLMAYGLSRKSL